MNGCIDSLNYSGHLFQIDKCANVVFYEVEQASSKFTHQSLLDLSKTCFSLYKHRLNDISPAIHKAGVQEYDMINEELVSLILPFDPLKFSFSITEDPSLHFFIRFSKNISLFIETYLDLEDGNDTYVQILKTNHTLYERNCMFDDAINDIKEILSNEFPKETETYKNLLKDIEQCYPFPQDLSQVPRK